MLDIDSDWRVIISDIEILHAISVDVVVLLVGEQCCIPPLRFRRRGTLNEGE